MTKWPPGRAQIKREIATLKLLKHPNVVRLYEVKLVSSLLCPLLIDSVLFFSPCCRVGTRRRRGRVAWAN